MSEYLGSCLEDTMFFKHFTDLLKYIQLKYDQEFSRLYEDTGLVMYEKYTRREVCRLLKWENDEGNVIFGYKVKHGTCPIFVTYNKDKEISYTINIKTNS